MTVRPWGIAVALALPLSMVGCLDVIGCWGDATWTEPGLSAWLETHGHDAGLGPGPPPPGLPLGPRLAAAIPEGAEVDSVWYLPSGPGDVQVDFDIRGTNVSVGAWSKSGRDFDPPPTADVLRVLDEALDAIYRGDEAARAAATEHVERWWPEMRRGDWMRLDLELAGPWDVDALFPSGVAFASERSFHNADAGDWHVAARSTAWFYAWDVHSMEADTEDRVFLSVSKMDYGRQAKDLVNSTFPEFPWTFQGFEYETSCVPGPIF